MQAGSLSMLTTKAPREAAVSENSPVFAQIPYHTGVDLLHHPLYECGLAGHILAAVSPDVTIPFPDRG